MRLPSQLLERLENGLIEGGIWQLVADKERVSHNSPAHVK